MLIKHLLPFSLLATSCAANFICGSENPPQSLIDLAKLQALQELVEDASGILPKVVANLLRRNINVDTYVHIVTTPEAENDYTDSQIANQIKAMNKAYNPYSINFNYISTSRTVNTDWATGQDDFGMKSALRQGNYAALNLYFLSDLGNGLLGFCYFPTDVSSSSTDPAVVIDGCVNLASSLPGGAAVNYNMGGTAIHEVGHWFGLFHVFQGSSCDGPGDSVFDTPRQSTPTSGCPASKDSCANRDIQSAGLDSVHNYMDYSYDVCYTEFTFGQKRRMFKMYNQFRGRFAKGWL